LSFALFALRDIPRRFGVVGFGEGRSECEVAEVADVELEYRSEVVTGGDSGSSGSERRVSGVVWYSAGRPCEEERRLVLGLRMSPQGLSETTYGSLVRCEM
jgi:hypothetical protein